MNTEVHDYNFLVSVSTSLQPIILSEVGDKKLTTIFLETVVVVVVYFITNITSNYRDTDN